MQTLVFVKESGVRENQVRIIQVSFALQWGSQAVKTCASSQQTNKQTNNNNNNKTNQQQQQTACTSKPKTQLYNKHKWQLLQQQQQEGWQQKLKQFMGTIIPLSSSQLPLSQILLPSTTANVDNFRDWYTRTRKGSEGQKEVPTWERVGASPPATMDLFLRSPSCVGDKQTKVPSLCLYQTWTAKLHVREQSLNHISLGKKRQA